MAEARDQNARASSRRSDLWGSRSGMAPGMGMQEAQGGHGQDLSLSGDSRRSASAGGAIVVISAVLVGFGGAGAWAYERILA